MVLTIISPRGAVDVRPSTRGKPSSAGEGSSTGIEVTRGSEVCEQVLNKGTYTEQMITAIKVDLDFMS